MIQFSKNILTHDTIGLTLSLGINFDRLPFNLQLNYLKKRNKSVHDTWQNDFLSLSISFFFLKDIRSRSRALSVLLFE